MSGERIFVTGANGCVGHELVRRLLEAGFAVTALALDDDDTANIPARQVRIEFGDICDDDGMREIFSRNSFDAVIHLAALVHRPGATDELYRRVNLEATARLYGLAHQTGVRQFIFISTVAVFGDRTNGALDESDSPQPATSYGRSKLAAERYLRETAREPLHYTIIRPATVYGPHDRGNIRRLFQLARRGVVPVPGDGSNLKSFVFTGNLADGIIKTIFNPAAYGQLFIMSDSRPYSLDEILREMASVLGKKVRVIHLPKAPLFWILNVGNRAFNFFFKFRPLPAQSLEKISTSNIYSCQKAREVLGYEPVLSLRDGLRRSYLQEDEV